MSREVTFKVSDREVEMSFWDVHVAAHKRDPERFPPRAERYGLRAPIGPSDDPGAVIKLLWRSYLVTEKLLRTGEYDEAISKRIASVFEPGMRADLTEGP